MISFFLSPILSHSRHREDLSEKESDSYNDDEEGNLSFCVEKYRSNTKKCSKEVYDIPDSILRESEIEESIVEMMSLISFHRILS